MKPFLVCIHDATPAFAREFREMFAELTPMVESRISLGVVPNWRGQWHLTAHPEYCDLIRTHADELLLHGYFHHRQRGWGLVTWLAGGSDEMNGLDAQETQQTIERGQRVFREVFGKPARGFLAPAWQLGRVSATNTLGLDHVLGFFTLESLSGRRFPLATSTWDCGRWSWLGYVGDGIGRLSQSMDRGIPTLAIHPKDIERGFWPRVLQLIRTLLDAGYEPTTASRLLHSE
jgi:peptidoglycan/xylan/chitin deacetylase (PgdA/CDA1 family)